MVILRGVYKGMKNYILYLAGVMQEQSYLESNHYDDYKSAMASHAGSMSDYQKEVDKHRAMKREVDKDFAMRVYQAANAAWDAGRDVHFNTMTRRVKITPKNRAAIRLYGSQLQVARGRNWDSLSGQGIETMAHNLGVSLPDYTGLVPPEEPVAPEEPMAHQLSPEEYMDMKGGESFWHGVHKQAVKNELESGLVHPDHMARIASLYPDLASSR